MRVHFFHVAWLTTPPWKKRTLSGTFLPSRATERRHMEEMHPPDPPPQCPPFAGVTVAP
jgi:hypothetical protein